MPFKFFILILSSWIFYSNAGGPSFEVSFSSSSEPSSVTKKPCPEFKEYNDELKKCKQDLEDEKKAAMKEFDDFESKESASKGTPSFIKKANSIYTGHYNKMYKRNAAMHKFIVDHKPKDYPDDCLQEKEKEVDDLLEEVNNALKKRRDPLIKPK
ncbi:hypothetical protein PVAND_012359 [Polypedilum vanderplanki]|uniref:Uncharacterized protein n=1 Tax=Polypedilum vanderplanki TaxID=319348 RepID=A0A9J6CM86_POLVA|nr:hypothetical protein PVAND_012359 [Polypedilum vanderplanki]